jgi:hypothetical protein
MIPQDSFTIVAKVRAGSIDALRSLLTTMNYANCAGFADPNNSLAPFGDFKTIHFARFVVLADNALEDRAAYSQPAHDEPTSDGPTCKEPSCNWPTYLCFMVDCDGDADELLTHMVQKANRLREIFSHCEGCDGNANLRGWLRAYRVRPAASYVNWVGRSVGQVREEARLHCLLRKTLAEVDARDPQRILAQLRSSVAPAAPLTPTPPMPLAWRIRNLTHMLFPWLLAAVCLALFPVSTIVLLAVALLLFFIALRRHEQTDPIVDQPYECKKVEQLRKGEDRDVTNQYTAMGSIKPGRFRLWTEIVILYGVNWVARHIFTRGSIGRIGTIHFAHWMFLDQGRRGFFCSSYDGGHEAYMDDFINKAGFGLNLAFSSFMAYPTTDWLVGKGAWLEQEFKRFQRHHQIPTDVWYKAYPGLTARDLARNSRIRNGFEKATMSDDEIRRWLAEI